MEVRRWLSISPSLLLSVSFSSGEAFELGFFVGALALAGESEGQGLPEEGGVVFEGGEGEAALELEAEIGAGDGGEGGEGEEGDSRGLQHAVEAVPLRASDAAELGCGVAVEIEAEEREVAVAQEEIGALDGLGGGVAAQPEEASESIGWQGCGIEGVAAINQASPEAMGGSIFEEGAEERGGAGGGALGDELDETAFAETAAERIIKDGEAGGELGVRARGLGGEFLGEELAEAPNLVGRSGGRDCVHMNTIEAGLFMARIWCGNVERRTA